MPPAAGGALVLLAVAAIGGFTQAAQEPAGARRLRAIPSDVVSLLLDGRPGGDLEAEIAAAAPDASAGARAIELTIEVPRARLTADAGAVPGIEVYLYALGPAREVRAHLAERHAIVEDPGAPADGAGAAAPPAPATVRARLSALSPQDRLRILVRDEGSGRFTLREISMASLAADVGTASGEDRAPGDPIDAASGRWREPSRQEARADPDLESPAEVEKRRGRAKLLARAYEEILISYASGAGERAVEGLRRFEVDALQNDGKGKPPLLLAALVEGQTVVAERLAQREPDSLVPVLLLHLEAHDRHVEHLDLRFAAHARDRVSALAELYARTATTETAVRLASDALTAIGSYLQGANALVSGRRLLARAVELDPRNLAARLSIALGYESHGEYEDALRLLAELSSFGSFDDEVRLRRATLLGRLGRSEEATAIYESLIAGSNETWIVTLAYQELARIHLASGRPAAAAAALERGTRRFPRDPTLLLQLAFALERQGAPRRALAILEGVDSVRVEGATPSPARTRYQRGLDAIDVRSELLARSGLALLPMLAGTLESLQGRTTAGVS